MTDVYLDVTERYPVWIIVEGADAVEDRCVTVDEETAQRWRAAVQDYNAAQKEMREKYEDRYGKYSY